MTLEERRKLLVDELNDIVERVVAPDTFSQRDAAGNPAEGSPLWELERRMREKTAELEAINARMNAPSYRFRVTSRSLLWLLWLAAAALLLFTFTMAPFIGPGYQLLFGVLTILSIVWAIWAGASPSV